MRNEFIYTLNSGFREDFNIKGYEFGQGEKSACIVGSMRGHEYQQLYICSLLVAKLSELEKIGAIKNGKSILVIPSINNISMNVGKKYWVSDNSDINRQFPGNPDGEATSRIAASVMEAVKGYSYGIQFASFYLEGDFIPHVRMMETGFQSTSLANLFGLPYVVTSKPRAFDKATLNYNWQINGTSAFSVYTSATERIDDKMARQAVSSVLRFLTRMGIVKYNCHNGYIASMIEEEELVTVKSSRAGFFRKIIGINEEIKRGDVLAEVINPFLGNVETQIIALSDGIIFFEQTSPMLYQNTVVYKIIKKLHE